jgi:sodium/potassium-transporting ATPase subunit alpha
MLIHQLPLDAAFAAVRSGPIGLSHADATARRLEFGPNRIERLAQTPVAVRLVRQFTHFFAALLWVAALLALIADWWMPGQGMATLAVAIVAVIAINGAFSFWQEYRAEETMAVLQRPFATPGTGAAQRRNSRDRLRGCRSRGRHLSDRRG